MDPHEEDWARIGEGLRNYQPAGDPEGDFALFQELQQKEKKKPMAALLIWLGLGSALLLLAAGVAFLLLPTASEKNNTEVAKGAIAIVVPATEKTVEKIIPLIGGFDEIAIFKKNNENESSALVEEHKSLVFSVSLNDVDSQLPILNNTLISKPEEIPVEEILYLVADPGMAVRREATIALTAINWPAEELVVDQSLPTAVITMQETAEVMHKQRLMPQVTLGTGLSTHWRGNSFLSDIEYGMYLSIGVQQPIGRFLLDGRVGYRGHNLDVAVLGDNAKPWSHYEEKTNEFNGLGEEVEYTYLGVVDGYRGLEFSLLVGYRLNNKASLQVGGRYSLPSLSFRRTVHSSLDGDVTGMPSPYHSFVSEQPLVKYHDYGAVFGGQYRLSPTLSLEAQLHLGMVDLIEDMGERQERFNHSSSISIGVRYRMN
jgi:hypothetical protein